MHSIPGRDCEQLLESLITALKAHHTSDAELHQLYLETQWLLSNQKSGALVLPTDWELIVFKMIGSNKLRQFPGAYSAALELVATIRHLAKPSRAS